MRILSRIICFVIGFIFYQLISISRVFAAETNSSLMKEVANSFIEQPFSINTILTIFLEVLGTIWDYRIVTIDKQPVTVSNIIIGLILFSIGLRISKKLSRVVKHKLLTKMHIDVSVSDALEKLAYYGSLGVMTLLIMDISNIPIKVFSFLGAALGLGFAFGSQNIFNNLISGIIILIERPFKIGDLIEVNGALGKVANIGARCTMVHLGSNTDILVPNSFLLQNQITNWTLDDTIVRVSATISVAYEASTEEVNNLLLRILNEHPQILKDPAPAVLLVSFDNSSLNYEMGFSFDVSTGDRKKITSDLNHAIARVFKEHRIDLAAYQREVYVETHKPLEIRLLQSDT